MALIIFVVLAAGCDDTVIDQRRGSAAPGASNDRDEPVTGPYGARRTGPSAETCETDGTRVSSVNSITGPGTFLLRRGSYGSMSVPPGATVKPYDCARVTITGAVSLGDNSTLAGVMIEADADWVLRINGDGITIRNNTIHGGTVEAVRIFDGASNVTLVGNNLDGGRDNHVVKVAGGAGSGNPDNIVIRNNRFTKTFYSDTTEDLLQLEGHDHVEITGNTFSANPRGEDGIDVKEGTDGMLVLRNAFEGTDIAGECLLVQGGYANNIVRDNLFKDCKAVSLGAHPEDRSDPWWRFEGNRLENSTLRVRRSADAEIVDVEMVGGTLQLGLTSQGDTPRDLHLTGNRFIRVTVDNNLRHEYTCSDNVMVDLAGDALDCVRTTAS
jgi:pectate lyase